jgi:hypothetical protein
MINESSLVFILSQKDLFLTVKHKPNMKKIFLLFILSLIVNVAKAQLVNIESKRMQTDSIRFVLNNDFAFNYTDNNGKYLYQISDALTTQFKSKDLRQIYLLLGNYKLIRTADQDFANSWFLHFRVNYKLSNLFRLESFIQSQGDKVLDVNSRNLIGLGFRLKLISKENTKLYLGNTYMYEMERSDEFDKQYFHHRNSTYFSYTGHFPSLDLTVINTLYYQPLYNDFSDYRLLEQLKVKYPITDYLKIFVLYDYYYDSFTPKERAQYSSSTKIGFSVSL